MVETEARSLRVAVGAKSVLTSITKYNILYIDTGSIYPYECNITH
jgi:hypothetical protein